MAHGTSYLKEITHDNKATKSVDTIPPAPICLNAFASANVRNVNLLFSRFCLQLLCYLRFCKPILRKLLILGITYPGGWRLQCVPSRSDQPRISTDLSP